MKNLIETIRNTLKTEACEAHRISLLRFFKEPNKVHIHGIKFADVKRMAKTYFSEVKDLPKSELFTVCERLLQTGSLEESSIACAWLSKILPQLKPVDWTYFDRWVDASITNWGTCDVFCGGIVGTFLEMYPQCVKKLQTWAKSKNLWKRRSAAVSLVGPARKGLFHKDVFEIAEILLLDSEDMVQKGYGWMLKEASKFDQQAVFQFVMKHKTMMPRTALRYAIEKMPKNLKNRAMKQN